MTPDEIRAALERARAADHEVCLFGDDTVLYGCIVEVRELDVLVSGRGAVVLRPLIPLDRIERVHILPVAPTKEAVRRLHLERAKADDRRAWVAARDAERRGGAR